MSFIEKDMFFMKATAVDNQNHFFSKQREEG